MKKVNIIVTILIFLSSSYTFGINTANLVCRKALSQISKPLLSTAYMVEVHKLGSELNSLATCKYPIYLSEINTGLIYFTEPVKGSNSGDNRGVFFSKYDSASSSWEKPIDLEKEYSKFSEINKVMNFDEIFVTINDDIYRVDLKASAYIPQKLNINTKYAERSPTLSPDGNTLYFISDRPEGMGGKDVWASERLSNNKWSQPYNLGKTINTDVDEESPFLMPDGVTLYFSSKGHNSYGGYDIFVATMNDEGLWSAPEKLDAPVNSTSDDFYYISNSNGDMAYYSSDKLSKDQQDIFIVRYRPLNN
jgi:hypothetical protein